MVLDTAAGKARDVDVTVTLKETPDVTRAFKAYEVKREKTALDVADVEQLCQKLLDMPSITHRAIVSASPFTAPAQAKARQHGVELYVLLPWEERLDAQFPALPMKGLPQECIRFSRTLLYWVDTQLAVVAADAKNEFEITAVDRLSRADGSPHQGFPTFADYAFELQLRSTEILFPLEPAETIRRTFSPTPIGAESAVALGPRWPHTHTLDVERDGVFFSTNGGLVQLTSVTINGSLQWQQTNEKPIYYVIERLPDRTPYAGAVVATGAREGTMYGLLFSPTSRDVSVHNVHLANKHLHAIRMLKLKE
jgi:hypothetical protein